MLVAILQPIILGWQRELVVLPGLFAMCAGGIWLRRTGPLGSTDGLAVGSCVVMGCGGSLVLARWASDRTGLNECGLMWYLCCASMTILLPLAAYEMVAEDLGVVMSSELWSDWQFLANAVAVVLLGALQLYSLFLCLTVNSPLTVA